MDHSKTKIRSFHGLRFLLTGACFVILVSGLKAAHSILVPFMFAVFLALLASGPIYWLKARKVPGSIAVFLVTVLILALFIALVFIMLSSVAQFSEQLPVYKTNLETILANFAARLNGFGINTSHFLQEINVGDYLGIVTKTLQGAVKTVSSFVLVIIMMIFMILEAASFRKKVSSALGNNVDLDKFDGVAVDVQKYLVIKTLTSALTGLLVGSWCYFLRIDFPVLWGMVAFILNYIPFLGSIIASVPAIILSLLQYDETMAITLAIGYLVINIGISNFLEPVFMGKRLGLSVLIVFMSLIFWGWIWGPAGALMSVPLTMIVKIVFEHSPQLSWVAVLMDSGFRLKKT